MDARKILNSNQWYPLLLTDGSTSRQETHGVAARVGNMLRVDDVCARWDCYFGLEPHTDYLAKEDVFEDVRRWLLMGRREPGGLEFFERLAWEMTEYMPWRRYVILSPEVENGT